MTDGRNAFANHTNVAYGSAKRWFDGTEHDTNELAVIPDAVYILTDGNLVCKGDDGVAGTFAVTAGQLLPIRPKVVTTATTCTYIGLVCT